MGYPVKQATTAQPLVFFMTDTADHITGKTGLSPTVTLSKNGAAFASPAGAVTEIGNGWYNVAGNATDNDTLGPLALHASASGADVTDDMFMVVAYDPQSATTLGLSGLDSNIKKNQALSAFEFMMTDDTNHAPATGRSVTVTRSIDGGGFSAGTLSAVSEVGSGIYSVNFLAADLNGNVVTLRAVASGCDDTFERIVTQP